MLVEVGGILTTHRRQLQHVNANAVAHRLQGLQGMFGSPGGAASPFPPFLQECLRRCSQYSCLECRQRASSCSCLNISGSANPKTIRCTNFMGNGDPPRLSTAGCSCLKINQQECKHNHIPMVGALQLQPLVAGQGLSRAG